jgi:hypothetical protein
MPLSDAAAINFVRSSMDVANVSDQLMMMVCVTEQLTRSNRRHKSKHEARLALGWKCSDFHSFNIDLLSFSHDDIENFAKSIVETAWLNRFLMLKIKVANFSKYYLHVEVNVLVQFRGWRSVVEYKIQKDN